MCRCGKCKAWFEWLEPAGVTGKRRRGNSLCSQIPFQQHIPLPLATRRIGSSKETPPRSQLGAGLLLTWNSSLLLDPLLCSCEAPAPRERRRFEAAPGNDPIPAQPSLPGLVGIQRRGIQEGKCKDKSLFVV